MNTIAAIKHLANELDCKYLREVTDSDINTQIETLDLQDLPVMIDVTEEDVDYLVGAGVFASINLSVRVMRLANPDDLQPDSDYIVTECRGIAEQLALRLMSYQEGITAPASFSIDSTGFAKQYDEQLTGVELSMTLQWQVVACP